MSSSNQQLTTQPNAAMAERRGKVQQLLDLIMPKITKLKTVSPERFAQIVLVEAGRNPKLAECTPASLGACLMLSAELGLEPSGPKGHAYLIARSTTIKGSSPPRKEMQCSLMLGYKGLADLARRSKEVARINAQAVYQGEIDRGLWSASLEPSEIIHKYALDIDRSDEELVAAYAVAEMKDGSKVMEILSFRQIEARRARGDDGPAWKTDYAKMARKTALRALLSGGLVPLGPDASKAMEAEDAAIDVTPAHTPNSEPLEPTQIPTATPEPQMPDAEFDDLPEDAGF